MKKLILIAMCAIGTFLSSSSIHATPPGSTTEVNNLTQAPRSTRPPPFTPETDKLLTEAIANNSRNGRIVVSWNDIASLVPGQTHLSCRARWINHLNIREISAWSREDDELLLTKHEGLGSNWDKISRFFDHKNPLSVKNRFYVLTNCSNKVSAMVLPENVSAARWVFKWPETLNRGLRMFSEDIFKELKEDLNGYDTLLMWSCPKAS